MKKLILFMVLALLISFPLRGGVKLDWGGLFYHYTFFWMNADFNGDVDDGDMHYYMHADLNVTAHFDENTSVFIRIGDWGNFGHHPVYGVGPHGAVDWSGGYADYLGAHIMEAYVSVQNILDSPIGFTGGIIPVLYGDIAFDGGENGFTGLKLNVTTDMFMLDLFSFRVIEQGGMGYMFYGQGLFGTGILPDADLDLHGAWATVKIPDANIEFNGFGFIEKWGEDAPMWIGARSTGSPIEGLSYVADFSKMMGSDEADTNYAGMYFSARAKYTIPGVPATVGGGYYYFSGDDLATDECEGYYSPTGGPYPNDFYKGWPGFGPAYTLWSPYGFNLVEPNLTVINANIGYDAEMISLRGDFFMYSLAEVPDGVESDMGMEFAVHAWINLSEAFGLGVTGGYWMPGDHFAPNEDAMLAGYTYIYKPF